MYKAEDLNDTEEKKEVHHSKTSDQTETNIIKKTAIIDSLKTAPLT